MNKKYFLVSAFGGEKWKSNVILTAFSCSGYVNKELVGLQSLNLARGPGAWPLKSALGPKIMFLGSVTDFQKYWGVVVFCLFLGS